MIITITAAIAIPWYPAISRASRCQSPFASLSPWVTVKEVGLINAVNAKVIILSRKRRNSSRRSATYGIKTGTSGITVPSSVLTNPPDEAIVTAVVVLKFATIISLAAEISRMPIGERIRAIDRLVVINHYQQLSGDDPVLPWAGWPNVRAYKTHKSTAGMTRICCDMVTAVRIRMHLFAATLFANSRPGHARHTTASLGEACLGEVARAAGANGLTLRRRPHSPRTPKPAAFLTIRKAGKQP